MTVVPVTRQKILTGNPDPAGHLFSWQTYRSAMSELIPPGTTDGAKVRTVAFGPGHLYSGRVTQFRFMSVFRVGSPGRHRNFHISPHDPSARAPDYWNAFMRSGAGVHGVSALSFDWYEGQTYDGQTGLMVVAQSQGDENRKQYHWSILSDDECRAARRSLTPVVVEGEIRWGRTDLPTPGSVKARLAGETAWRVDTGPVNTHWWGQEMMVLWEGAYWSSGMPVQCELDIAPMQLGRTREEMLADTPTVFGGGWGTGARSSVGSYTYDGTIEPPPSPSGHGPIQQALIDGWALKKDSTFHKRWVAQYPAESMLLDRYWANGGEPPVLASKMGRGLVRDAQAAWLAASEHL